MYEHELNDIINTVVAVTCLVLSAAVLGVGFYIAWLVIKALHKYLAN